MSVVKRNLEKPDCEIVLNKAISQINNSKWEAIKTGIDDNRW